jgi:uncharacterized protein YqgC (DUF456 family)
MDSWLYYSLATVLLWAGTLCWLSNLFSLPGNWAMLALAVLFAYFIPQEGTRGVSLKTLWILLALAVMGEIIEFAAGAMGAAKQGASRRSIWLSLAGAMVGSILGATAGLPVPVIGSMIGALAGGATGAFAGAYLGEVWSRRSHATGVAVGRAAFVGRLWGTLGKFALGAVMLGVAAADALFV